MRVLITGICGFVGNALACGILRHCENASITGLDSLIRPGSEQNLIPLRSLGIDVRVGDLRNATDVDDLPACDWVLDCAANPSVLAGLDGRTSPKDLLDHNLSGTIHLLEYCRRHGAGFVLMSTSRVYSLEPLARMAVAVRENAFFPKEHVPGLGANGLTEAFPAEPPLSLYGSSKRCSEILALEYHAAFGFPVYINRCGVIAGAGQFGRADQGIFSYWIHSWRKRAPLRYLGFEGTGHQVRDCLHPDDLLPVVVAQLKTPNRGPSRILNLSGSGSLSLAQLSEWCSKRLGPHEILRDGTPRPFDVPWLVLDSTAARATWNWAPTRTVSSILEEIATHAETHPDWLALTA